MPVLRRALAALDLAPGSRGVDLGCGNGGVTQLMASAVAPGGHVLGLDLRADLVDLARQAAAASPWAGQLDFKQGDLDHLPQTQGGWDWLLSVDCLGYGFCPTPEQMQTLTQALRPGGKLGYMFWSGQQLLPGYPALEARLGATRAGLAPFAAGREPRAHPSRGLGWLRAAGLERVQGLTLAGTAQAPLTPPLRRALASLLEMRWPGAQEELSPADRDLFARLSWPDSPEYILDLPDYYAFFTYTLIWGLAG